MVVLRCEQALFEELQSGHPHGSVQFAHGFPPRALIFFHEAWMRSIGEVRENGADRLQTEQAGYVVGIQLVPLIEQSSVLGTGYGSDLAELFLFDPRRQRTIAILLTEEYLRYQSARRIVSSFRWEEEPCARQKHEHMPFHFGRATAFSPLPILTFKTKEEIASSFQPRQIFARANQYFLHVSAARSPSSLK